MGKRRGGMRRLIKRNWIARFLSGSCSGGALWLAKRGFGCQARKGSSMAATGIGTTRRGRRGRGRGGGGVQVGSQKGQRGGAPGARVWCTRVAGTGEIEPGSVGRATGAELTIVARQLDEECQGGNYITWQRWTGKRGGGGDETGIQLGSRSTGKTGNKDWEQLGTTGNKTGGKWMDSLDWMLDWMLDGC